eukprot:7225799-Karenia_brevis.AAC.1
MDNLPPPNLLGWTSLPPGYLDGRPSPSTLHGRTTFAIWIIYMDDLPSLNCLDGQPSPPG